MQHKNYVHKIITISIAFLMSIANYANDIRIRSQSVDTARELAGWTNHVNLYNVCDTYGTFAITPEYTQSFNSRQIARSLFGSAIIQNESCDSTCDSNTDKFSSFRVSGSQAAGRQAGDLLADYFGLPLDYESVVNVRPVIENFLVDFDLFVGLDKCLEGLWVRIHAPVVYAKWKLRMEEDQVNKGTVGYPIGYFAPVAIPASALNTSFVSYLQGNAPDLSSYGVTLDPLQNGIFKNGVVSSTDTCSTITGKQHTTRLSDIRFAIGQNFWQCEDYHIGAGLLIAAPTGSKVNDKYIFRPFVGNGHHWEFGAKITSHYTLWRGCDDDKSLGLYIDADVTTLLSTRQFRVFDICGAGDNSKYMLAEQMTDQVTNNLATSVPNGQTPIITNVLYQFANKLTPVANFAAQNVKVNQDLQLDLTAMFNYTHCKFATGVSLLANWYNTLVIIGVWPLGTLVARLLVT
ncbi:MAG: hypothetical protein M1114_06400 [Candidatus Dependentiae bacterium]|nr:hypothetical protein [Candidatus Dependentiae bacterium]